MWQCPRCQERVDDAFEVCWSCGTTPEGVEDPDFLTADETGPIVDPAEDLDRALDDSKEDFAGTPPLSDLLDCYEAENIVEAKFVADRLVEEGIPAVAATHDINLTLGGFIPRAWGYGPRVRVRPDDLPRALAWVADYRRRKSKSGPKPPADDDD
jgi:hypothetical protein